MPLSSRRHRHSSADPTPHRAIRAEVLAALLAKGSPVPPHTVDVVIAAGERLAGCPPALWTLADVEALAWYGLVDHAHEIGAPLDGLAPAALQLAAAIDPGDDRGFVHAMAQVFDPTSAPSGAPHPTMQPA